MQPTVKGFLELSEKCPKYLSLISVTFPVLQHCEKAILCTETLPKTTLKWIYEQCKFFIQKFFNISEKIGRMGTGR